MGVTWESRIRICVFTQQHNELTVKGWQQKNKNKKNFFLDAHFSSEAHVHYNAHAQESKNLTLWKMNETVVWHYLVHAPRKGRLH